jgi:hypothetical protein
MVLRWIGCVLALSIVMPRVARAQCGGRRSSCRACHEASGGATYEASARWHEDHAFADLCAACHGGDPASPAPADAHASLTAPDRACADCHAANDPQRPHYARASGASRRTAPLARPRDDRAIAAASVALGLAGAGLVSWNERRLRRARDRREDAP